MYDVMFNVDTKSTHYMHTHTQTHLYRYIFKSGLKNLTMF